MLLWGGSFLELATDPVLENADQSCKLLNTLKTDFQRHQKYSNHSNFLDYVSGTLLDQKNQPQGSIYIIIKCKKKKKLTTK